MFWLTDIKYRQIMNRNLKIDYLTMSNIEPVVYTFLSSLTFI